MPGEDSDEDEVDDFEHLDASEAIEKVDKKKEKKNKKQKNRVGKSYPTQYMRVGAIHCLFLSCFNKGRSPIISLGPSWPFTLFLLLLATLILGYFTMML